MYGEIDLELYTIAIIRLNTALEKLETSEITPDIIDMFQESTTNIQELYNDIIDDLNQDEVNLNEYYLFFENGKQTFPQYIEILNEINYEELEDILNSLINVFKNLNKISQAFSKENRW